MLKFILFAIITVHSLANANESANPDSENPPPFTFKNIPVEHSKIQFNNSIIEDQVHNLFNFSYIYNGAGVAVGDINNDDLVDIYFSGNQVKNQLYLNKGNFKFQDITPEAFDKRGVSTSLS